MRRQPPPWRDLRGLGAAGAALLLLAAWPHSGAGDPAVREAGSATWTPGQPVPIAVRGGAARFDLPPGPPGSRTLVIVSALATGHGPFPVRLGARPTGTVMPPERAEARPVRPPRILPPPEDPPPGSEPGMPPPERDFHLMVGDGDAASASNYLAVTARLRAVGRRVQVYVDRADLDRVGEATLRDVVVTFDDRIAPAAAAELGPAHDVDGDGRFTVLISGWLGRLGDGRLSVDGFFRGADLDPALGPPFGNRCDMIYLNAALEAGPHLRTVLAHEYTHAVVASRKAFGGPGGARSGPEEEGWIDEGLAHLAEDRHDFSRSNLDYRISAFLSAPERYRLVVEDYYAADLFRSHGNRGSTYLFLRWCADRFGDGLIRTLARSPRRGIAGLEEATGWTFPELFREWTIALALAGLDPAADPAGGYRSLDLRGPLDRWALAGPRTSRVAAGGGPDAWLAAGTSPHFAVVTPSPAGATRVEVTGPPEADLQVTAIPLPADLPELELTLRPVPGDGEDDLRVIARLRERSGQPVQLVALAWEPAVPEADPRTSSSRLGGLDALGLAATFGTSTLSGGGALASRPIPLPGSRLGAGPLIVKALGLDALGRRVAAWAELTPPTNRPADLAARDPLAP